MEKTWKPRRCLRKACYPDMGSRKSVFKESYLRTDSRKILFCYKMQFRINRIIREIIERGHDKYAYLSRAKNLVWGLLIQAVLNDDKLSFKLEQFGNTMGIESDYTEYLKDLASKRVRLIISEALDEDRYKKAIQEEKYSFLRTKSTFQKCMETAYNKYSWTKKSL